MGTEVNSRRPTPATYLPATGAAHTKTAAGDDGLTVQFRSARNPNGNQWRVCNLDTEDIRRATGSAGGNEVEGYIFEQKADDEASSLNIHSDLHELIDSFVINTNFFSHTYGSGYGEMQFLGHWGGGTRPIQYKVSKVELPSRKKSFIRSMPRSEVLKMLKRELPEGVEGIPAVPETYDPVGLSNDQLAHVNAVYKAQNLEEYTQIKERLVEVSPSWHYHTKALDIFWIGWRGTPTGAIERPVASRPCNGFGEAAFSLTAYRRLVAVEAGLRKWFGRVINRGISQHHNHFHVDTGRAIAMDAGPNGTESTNRFVQDCIRAFTDVQPSYDGDWGSAVEPLSLTEEGYRTLMSDLGMESLNPMSNSGAYLLFLDYIMMHGFADARAGTFRWENATLY